MTQKVEYFGIFENLQNDLGLFELDPLIQPPISALTYIRNKDAFNFLKCPATVDYLKNVYYIMSPLDFTIYKTKENHFSIINDKNGSDLKSFLFLNYPEVVPLNTVPMCQIHLQYYFLSKSNDLIIEVIDPPLSTIPITNICGEFNIGKWVRPTNFSFYIDPNCEHISFTRNDPLYAVRFRSKEKINLIEILDDKRKEQVLVEQQKAVSIKKWYPNLKLDDAYDLFKQRMKILKKKSC